MLRRNEFNHLPTESSQKPQVYIDNIVGRFQLGQSRYACSPHCLGNQTNKYPTSDCGTNLRKCWSSYSIYHQSDPCTTHSSSETSANRLELSHSNNLQSLLHHHWRGAPRNHFD